MTRPTHSGDRPAELSVADLFAQYLHKQIDAHAAGLGIPETVGDALPHEAVPVQPVDPALAWKDAVTAARLLAGADQPFEVPPEWPTLVARQEPAVSLAFALGNFPQLVRNLHPLLGGDPAALLDEPREPLAVPDVGEWATQAGSEPARLLAAGVLRLARQFESAEKLLAFGPSPEWRGPHANESAALAWHAGDHEKALAIWQSMPDSAVTHFNRGMAQLFLGRAAEAVESLTAAVGLLPETSAWHHLGQLYLALAQGR